MGVMADVVARGRVAPGLQSVLDLDADPLAQIIQGQCGDADELALHFL